MLVLDVEERPLGHVLIVSGDLDVATAPQVRSEVVRLLGDGISDLVIDLTRVDFIDSFGLGVLVGALKRVRGREATWGWSSPSHGSARSSR